MVKQIKQTASVSEEQKDTMANVITNINNNLMRKDLIQPTVFVEEKTKTPADVVVLQNGEVWIYKNPYDNDWLRTPDCKPVKYPSSVYANDYLIHVTPRVPTGRKRYKLLNLRLYSKLRRTSKKKQMLLEVPDSMPPWVAERVLRDEFEKQLQYLNKHVWNKDGKEAA